ncbi:MULTISPECIES: HAD-IIA family hydrolase [unclassified Schaalia]|uniref:HAD-IIA family hydrolase n=1 Tax=unclassified Schaalia TaxID=2691889 RepID=UPI001E3C544F|nr:MULTISPECIES: HAD-IIA family hydrolase [unclassified Schaalia]MCD4549028.1 HAD-IIA family hydrolase [Schaalia sp. lx-260]MCD4557216.1 HAD-IIA family hydrolase [Schaalia sp. lx-100]
MKRTAPTELYDAYIFDMDGTIYLGDDLLPGAKRLIEGLRELGRPVRFLSNNPTKDPELYVDKLKKLGIPTPINEIANTVVTTVRWLTAHHPNATVFPISEEPLKKALRDAGIKISENPQEIDIVIASYDRTFDYRKLQIAFDAIWYHKRAFLITTNPDRYCPFPGGRGEPDAAAIVGAITGCTGTTLTANMGKPEPIMLSAAIDGLNVDPARCIMVGDRLTTDIGMAIKTGMYSCLLLTGDSTLEEAEALDKSQQPTYVLDRIDHLIPQQIRDQWGWKDSDN